MKLESTEEAKMSAAQPDVQCTNCTMGLRSENALMVDGKPYCDEFCHGMWARAEAQRWLALRGPTEARDSIEITRNAQGKYGWKIKMYLDANTVVNRDKAMNAIDRIDNNLRGDYLDDGGD